MAAIFRDVSVTAHRLLPRVLQAVADLFEAADIEPPSQAANGRVELPTTLQSIDDAAFAAAPVRIGMLGPIAVRATGPMDPSRVPLAAEVVTYLAAHPGGVHPSVLAAAIWPRGVTHAVATATIDRVRDWLGDDADGAARLRTDESGRYLLAPNVAVDWHSFCTLLLRSRRASSPDEEAELLRRALHLVRGTVLQDRPTTRYTWLVRTSLERTIETVVCRCGPSPGPDLFDDGQPKGLRRGGALRSAAGPHLPDPVARPVGGGASGWR
jgi:hypothetical protein